MLFSLFLLVTVIFILQLQVIKLHFAAEVSIFKSMLDLAYKSINLKYLGWVINNMLPDYKSEANFLGFQFSLETNEYLTGAKTNS